MSTSSQEIGKQVELAKTSFEHMRFQVSELEKRSGFLITATAFFLTATAALLNNATVRDVSYAFPNGTRIRLAVLFLIASLLLGTFAVIHAVLAIGPQVRHFQHVTLSQPSFLSFLSIAERPLNEWEKVTNKSSIGAVDRYLREMYAREAAELSKEAQYRYGRLGEVRAFLFLAVAALAMGLILVVDSLSKDRSSSTLVQWSDKTAIAMGLVVAALTFIAGQDRVRIEDDGWTDGAGPNSTVSLLRRNAAWLSLTGGLVVVSVGGNLLAFIGALISLVPPIHSAIRRRRRLGRSFRILDRVSVVPQVTIAGALIILYAFHSLRVFLLVAAILPLVALEGIRLVYLLDTLLWCGRAARQGLESCKRALQHLQRVSSYVARQLPASIRRP